MKATHKRGVGPAALLLAVSLLLSGCWDRHETNTLAIITGVGIDMAEHGMIALTLQVKKALDSRDSAGSDSGDSYITIQKTGNGILQSYRDVTLSSSRRLILQHNQVIVFGREQAEKDMLQMLDFFLRDYESRIDVWVFIADGMANDLLSVSSQIEKLPSEHLTRLRTNQDMTSQAYGTDLLRLIQRLRSKSRAGAVSFAMVIDESESPTLSLEGLAVVKEGRMVGQMNRKETMGFRWILNEVRNGILPLYTELGTAFLEIKSSKTKLSISMKDGVPHVKLLINEHVSLAELHRFSAIPITELDNILVDEGKQLIKDSVYASLDKAKELNADIFGFADLMYQHHFQDWKKIADRWDELFPKLELEVEVQLTMDAVGEFVRMGKGNVVLMYA